MILGECQIPSDNMAETYEAMKALDLDGSGDVDRAEVYYAYLSCLIVTCM